MLGSSAPSSSSSGGSFARRFDSFFYKRIDASELTNATSIGACLSLASILTLIVLFILETVSFLTPSLIQDVVMAQASDAPLRVNFNITFPSMPCAYLSLASSDVLGLHATNISRNIQRYRVDKASGKILMRVEDSLPATPAYDAVLASGDNTVQKAGDNSGGGGGGGGGGGRQLQEGAGRAGILLSGARTLSPGEADKEVVPTSTVLTPSNFEAFVRENELAFVAYGAPWCPWSQRLLPAWEKVSSIVQGVPDIRLGRVDCTDAAAGALCQAAHVNAFPTLVLYKGGAQHSHAHYHGDRSVQAILNFLVLARQSTDAALGADPHSLPPATPGGDDPSHSVMDRLAQALHMLPEGDGGAKDHAGHDHGGGGHNHGGHDDDAAAAAAAAAADPADPGSALALIESMHQAGFSAPGDTARALTRAAMTPEEIEKASTCGPEGSAKGVDDSAASSFSALARKLQNPVAPSPQAAPAPSGAEGCMISGFLEVKRVPGSFSFNVHVPGRSPDLDAFDMSHVVHELFFGPRVTTYQLSRLPQGTSSELHRLRRSSFNSAAKRTSHIHHISVVETTFKFSTGHEVEAYRYTANSNSFIDERVGSFDATRTAIATAAGKGGDEEGGDKEVILPSTTFDYSLSPMAINIAEVRKPLYHFITYLCALAGGVMTVVSLLDTLLHASFTSSKFKQGIGKKG